MSLKRTLCDIVHSPRHALGKSQFTWIAGLLLTLSATVATASSTSVTLTAVRADPLRGVSEIASGTAHTCAVSSTGGVKCWGDNQFGQVGEKGPAWKVLVPTEVRGLNGDITAIAAGSSHTCAVSALGDIQCWGSNPVGELGNNAHTNSAMPVNVIASGSKFSAVAAGLNFTCALTTTGAVQCWGWNDKGQLGNDSLTSSPIPVQVAGLVSGVKAIATGSKHACALMNAGTVKCWGNNFFAQLGDGSQAQGLKPVDVSGLDAQAIAIAAGAHHTCVITAGDTMKCWGANYSGQLGNNFVPQANSAPVDASLMTSPVKALALSDHFTCAVTKAGGVECWGLGFGNTVRSMSIPGLATGATHISAGMFGFSAITANGEVKSWGSNSSGQFGDATNVGDHLGSALSGESPNFALPKRPVTLIATISRASSTNPGSVAFMDGNTPIIGCEATQLDISGRYLCKLNTLPAGNHAIKAVYSGSEISGIPPGISPVLVLGVRRPLNLPALLLPLF
ncbi:MAG: Ig-like domain repeat protein [Pseudomonadota bacterium]